MRPGDTDTIMVGHAYARPVIEALGALPGRRKSAKALDAYMTMLIHIGHQTGEIALTSYQLADEIGASAALTEEVLVELARLRVIVRDPRRGDAAWCINPHLAWSGDLKARARFAALVPPPDVEPRA